MVKIKCTIMSFLLLKISANVFKNLTPKHGIEKKDLSYEKKYKSGFALLTIIMFRAWFHGLKVIYQTLYRD